MIKLFEWLKRLFCRAKPECEHHYRKHWSRKAAPYGAYVQRCAKCGKVE